MRKRFRLPWFFTALWFECLFLFGCSQRGPTETVSQSGGSYVPPYSWTTIDPTAAGIDTALLRQALDQIQTEPFIYSFLLVRDTLLVSEYYQQPFSQFNDYDIRSASKSFISALVGIALDKGVIDSLDQKIFDFFPEYIKPTMDTRKLDITIRHLLTMRAGFDYTEGADYSDLFTSSVDWVEVILDLPLKFDPGQQFYYATPQTHLLSVIITRSSGMSTLDFARTHLFQHLSIDVRHWYQDPQGYFYGGTGMNFTPRDLARFGLLYLQNGTLHDTPVVPSAWITNSVQPQNSQPITWGSFQNVNYGYSWWTQTNTTDSLFMAAGHAGQLIVVVPMKQLVVVVTANPDVSPNVADTQFSAIIGIIDRYILPSASPSVNP